MAYRIEKETNDIIIDGFEQGISPSPHKGIANIQNANISTESGEITASFVRAQQSMTSSATGTGTLAFVDSTHVSLSITNSNNLFKGNWITVTNSSHTGELPNGTYYVPPSTGSNFQLSQYYNVANFTLPASISYLIVGGGGGGGSGFNSGIDTAGGGGGGGQVRTGTVSATAQAYSIVIGTGGTGGTLGSAGSTGVSSSAFSVTSVGGVGGSAAPDANNGGAGGAAGGGNAGGAGGTGNAGGPDGGGGGGGDGSVGSAGSGGTSGGNGGNGTASSITGSAVTYAGGGGGGGSATGGTGGTGGGGAGVTNTNGTAGTANTGGGGGGFNRPAVGRVGGTGGTGVVIVSYPIGSIIGATGGTISYETTNKVHTFNSSGTFTVPTPIPSLMTGFTAGLTATIQLVANMGAPLARATETYFLNGTTYNRYYVLDSNNLVWVYDTQNETTYSSTDNVSWFLPDFNTNYCGTATGVGVISGFLVVAASDGLFGKSTALLGNTNSTTTTWTRFSNIPNSWAGSGQSTTVPHFCYVGHQGHLYTTDKLYVADVFPDSTLADAAATAQNVQSFCSYPVPTVNPLQGSLSVIGGATPRGSDGKRVPAVFFTNASGSLPTAITAGTVYFIAILTDGTGFQVFSASTGGSAFDLQTGALGTQYFNTFYPISAAAGSGGATPTCVFTNQRLVLPAFEVAQTIGEIGNIALIGCGGNVVYPWDQVSNLPGGLINLPEGNVANIITVNQMAYLFAGNNGNVYITDGSTASLVINIPDYVAGVPGSPATYIEPQYTWGGAMYLRGRVYFSVLDQTATKAGNCGGIWSFVPTQNLYIGQDTGVALRLEASNSYQTYNGDAPLLITKLTQNATQPLYWSVWASSISSPAYGIDYSTSGTSAAAPYVVETDAIPVGTMLNKHTFQQFEYKLSAPLDQTATVTAKYRTELTAAWATVGTFEVDSTRLSGYVPQVVEKAQWLQLQFTVTPATSSAATNTFARLKEIRIR